MFRIIYGLKSSRERYTLAIIADDKHEARLFAWKHISTEYPYKTFWDRGELYHINTYEDHTNKGVLMINSVM